MAGHEIPGTRRKLEFDENGEPVLDAEALAKKLRRANMARVERVMNILVVFGNAGVVEMPGTITDDIVEGVTGRLKWGKRNHGVEVVRWAASGTIQGPEQDPAHTTQALRELERVKTFAAKPDQFGLIVIEGTDFHDIDYQGDKGTPEIVDGLMGVIRNTRKHGYRYKLDEAAHKTIDPLLLLTGPGDWSNVLSSPKAVIHEAGFLSEINISLAAMPNGPVRSYQDGAYTLESPGASLARTVSQNASAPPSE